MAGLSFSAAVGQALWAGKLFHIDLNSQNGPRFDQDFRFGAEDIKEAFLTVRLLERAGYDGPRHFDARAYRSEDDGDVYAAFARGCIRNYKILAAKAAAFDADPAIRDACLAAGSGELAEPTPVFSPETLRAIREEDFAQLLANREGRHHELADQLMLELIFGV
jgi:xylose isomerase